MGLVGHVGEAGRLAGENLLADDAVEAVHLAVPNVLHYEMSKRALLAGKHVMCTVPMATTIEECEQIVRAAEEAGKKYMMMETVVYSREFLYVREMRDSGKLGRIQYQADLGVLIKRPGIKI